MAVSRDIKDLIRAEGWEQCGAGGSVGEDFVRLYGEVFPMVHPCLIHLKLYRTLTNPDLKYLHMKAAHDYLWPQHIDTWNAWSEKRFRAHCEGWSVITYAGGASTGKSFSAAQIALLFWLANPKKRAVLVMSTTMESLQSRIYGYCCRLLDDMKILLPYKIRRGNSPKIEYPGCVDSTHTISAIAAKKGDNDAAISSLIGRHPTEGLLIVADEATDLPMSILGAIPNLASGVQVFQFMAIGNSNSKFDLHGSLSTPKEGWASVDIQKVNQWETTQRNGICLFFDCYESPAIHETDPVKKKALSKFLITTDAIIEKEATYGANSTSFYRFVRGFWPPEDAAESVVVSRKFIEEYNPKRLAQFSGLQQLNIVAGLDPAFSTGGDVCMLRLAILGHATDGRIVLDFRGDTLLFKIKIRAVGADMPAELQIADQVIEILSAHNCSLANCAIDATGQGRALGEVIRLRARVHEQMIKIYSVAASVLKQKAFDVVIKTPLELWQEFKNFIATDQLRGMDFTTIEQVTQRQIVINALTRKQVLESKKAFKMRIGAISPSLAHSPDEADSAALAIQAAIIRFGFTPGQRRDYSLQRSFELDKFAAFTQQREEELASQAGWKSPKANFLSDVSEIQIRLPLTK